MRLDISPQIRELQQFLKGVGGEARVEEQGVAATDPMHTGVKIVSLHKPEPWADNLGTRLFHGLHDVIDTALDHITQVCSLEDIPETIPDLTANLTGSHDSPMTAYVNDKGQLILHGSNDELLPKIHLYREASEGYRERGDIFIFCKPGKDPDSSHQPDLDRSPGMPNPLMSI